MTNQIDSIIFDLDGTLWDAAETVAKAWRAARKKVDFQIQEITPDKVRSIAGTQHNLIFPMLFPQLSPAQQQELMEISAKEEMRSIQENGGDLYEGLEETLEYLHGKYRLFIVSNCQDGYIEAFLARHDLGRYFGDFECSGRTGNSKAINLKDIVERNNLQAPVYVGDTPGDLEAAQKAGVPFIHASYGYREVSEFEHRLERISDLTTLF
ncbi:HAD family hydrolase [Pontibacter sp. HSC-14F20]|uniref:HAD family hydrolase n=1 Tax=Pontibacter sp. HSC-14F20 TaxID=2864136 RepID=UPI001C737858|nr:HAD family hydrolase [Pontibacter sp. HSC-14F20]MBX0332572.1 HAD family hydrolase [Pontibacter sp. HSC-14F20]